MSDFTLSPYQSGDEDAINRAFNDVFDRCRTLEEWHWKFRPEASGSRIIVAVDKCNEIIAQYAAVQMRVQVNGCVYSAGQPVDVFCRRQPGAVEQRVYVRTVGEFFRRYGNPHHLPVLFGFPSDRPLRLGRLKLNYGEPLPVRIWQRPTIPRQVRSPNTAECPVVKPAMMDRLWKRAAHRYPVSVIRDGDWFKHRYLNRPNHHYIHLTVHRGRELSAWAVLQADKGVTRWIDLIWDGKDAQDVIEIDQKSNILEQSIGTKVAEMWLSGDHQVMQILFARGWRPYYYPKKIHLTSRSFHPLINTIDFSRNFYLTMGVSDLN